MLQADCFLTKTCSNGLRMAMVRTAVCSADCSSGTDSATACIQAGSLLADSKHPQADLAYFHKREFCFTLDGDIFVRYQSFKAGLSASTHTASFTLCHTIMLPACNVQYHFSCICRMVRNSEQPSTTNCQLSLILGLCTMWTPNIEMLTQVSILSDSVSLGNQVHDRH